MGFRIRVYGSVIKNVLKTRNELCIYNKGKILPGEVQGIRVVQPKLERCPQM